MDNIENDFIFLKYLPIGREIGQSESVAKIFGVESKENTISNWISYLLDPKRFKDSMPLKVFLELCMGNEFVEEMDLNDITISREYVLVNNRRIDLLIEHDNLILGIENKIFSNIHNDQLNDYQTSLIRKLTKENEMRRVCTILLAPSWSKDVKFIKDNNENQIIITYEELAEAFSNIPQKNIEFRHYFLLNEFVRYVDDYIKEEAMTMDYEWATYNTKHSEDLIKIVEKGAEQINALSNKIEKTLDEVGNEIFGESNFIINKKVTPNEFYFQLYPLEWERHKIHYEIILDKYSSKGFILPNNLLLRIDFENTKSKNFINDVAKINEFPKINRYNVIEKWDLNYDRQESINETFISIKNKLFESNNLNYTTLTNIVKQIDDR